MVQHKVGPLQRIKVTSGADQAASNSRKARHFAHLVAPSSRRLALGAECKTRTPRPSCCNTSVARPQGGFCLFVSIYTIKTSTYSKTAACMPKAAVERLFIAAYS